MGKVMISLAVVAALLFFAPHSVRAKDEKAPAADIKSLKSGDTLKVTDKSCLIATEIHYIKAVVLDGRNGAGRDKLVKSGQAIDLFEGDTIKVEKVDIVKSDEGKDYANITFTVSDGASKGKTCYLYSFLVANWGIAAK